MIVDAKMRYIITAGALAAFLLIIVGGILLAVLGRDVNEALAPVLGFATPTIAILFASAGIVKAQQASSTALSEIKHNVNGRLSQLLDNHEILQAKYNDLRSVAIKAGIELPEEEVKTE